MTHNLDTVHSYGPFNPISGSFFHAFPVSSSLGRSSLQYSAGGRSQVASLVACTVLLVTLVVGGRYFAVLPKAVLATIIFVNMALVVIRQVTLWFSN